MEVLNIQEKILFIVFTYDASKISKKDSAVTYKVINELICKEFIADNFLKKIPYDIIAKYVFESNERYDEDNELLNFNLEKIVEISESVNADNIKKFADKVKGNYKLSKEQKQYIQSNIDALNTEVASARKEVNSIKTIVNETQLKSENFIKDSKILNEEMIKTKDKLLSEFVGILGIFSALIFGLFGGFEGLSTSLALIAEDTSLGKTIMASSAVMIALISFTYTMMQWVGKLIDKPINSCGCPQGNDCKNKHSFADRHATYLIVIGITILSFLTGLLIMVGKSTGITSIISDWKNGYILFGFIGFIILGTLGFLIFKILKKHPPS